MFNWLKKTFADHANVNSENDIVRSCEEPLRQKSLRDECEWHKNLGNEFLAAGNLNAAAECYKQAIADNPNYAEGLLNLGFVLKEQLQYQEAERYLKQAILVNPKLEDAYYLLGGISQELGKLNSAIEYFSKALELKPDFEIVYHDLCHAFFLNGQVEKAMITIQKGIAVNPELPDFHGYLGNLYAHKQNFEMALACYQKMLSLQSDSEVLYSNMGKIFVELGRVDEAIASYQKAIAINPDSIHSYSCLLFIQSFNAKCSPAQYLAEAKAFGKKVLAQAKPYTSWHVDSTVGASQCLRVGLVSGDFRNHPVGFFLENILAALNKDRFKFFAYPTQPNEDDLTARIKRHFASWNPIEDLNDEAAARKIHEDNIHILIDLSGHTTHNRLPLFAWKPAPVQISWLGFLASTGVPGMDFMLADPVSVPESHRSHFSEQIWYLPDTVNCLTPPADSTKLSIPPPPVMRNGHITFGSFQNVTKLNDAVLATWGRIFDALPKARLRLHSKQMSLSTERKHIQQRLTRYGISPERVTIAGSIPSREVYLATYAEVDIILDSFPYPGITTTCEALWMGVPTLTLAGETMLARQGASLLTCVGLEEWIARNKDEYVALALTHAADVNRLVLLRSELRPKALTSTLFNAHRFALHLENALQGMWEQKIASSSDHG